MKGKKSFIVTVAFMLGFGLLMPFSTYASLENTEGDAQVEQLIKGLIVENWGNELIVLGEDGERYHVGLHTFTDEQLQSMNLLIGATIEINGEVLESVSDFYTFQVYVKWLPIGVTENDLLELERLYNQAQALNKQELWEESSNVWGQIDKITQPYYLINWEPEAFEEYIRYFEYPFTSDDRVLLEKLYTEWISLVKSGKDEESNIKMEQFDKVVNSYYVEPTFEEYIAGSDLVISEVDFPIIKQLYEEAIRTNNDEDFEQAMKKWEAFDLAMRPYYLIAYPMPTFEEQISYYDYEINEEDYVRLEEIYAQIIEQEENAYYESLDDLWMEYYSILDTYFTVDVSIPFRADQIVINGESFKA
ncbi:hypothetical protein [Sporosarcina sp. FA9]|uniref:hypothetical protein n=1 Tax=Sporosarcina sp. FA9 TaxID=3413030 RepID=UPI003F656C40